MKGSAKPPQPRPSRRYSAIGLLLFCLLLPARFAMADDTEEVLVPRFSAEGSLGVVAAGVGMMRNGAPGPGSIEIEVPGTAVRAAYLYWSGYGVEGTGDGTVTLTRAADGESMVVDASDHGGGATYGPLFWFDGFYCWVHVGDVTALIRNGRGAYVVSDFGEMLERRNGAGLIVVYEDVTLPRAKVLISDGLDRFYRAWGEGPRGESAVNCIPAAAGLMDWSLDLWMFAAEVVRQGEEEPRPNALWYLTGSGLPPVDLVNAPSNGPVTGNMLQGPPAEYPFASRDGLQWDTYHSSAVIPAGRGWVCLQVESAIDPQDESWRPASGILLAQAVSLSQERGSTDTPTATPGPSKTSTPIPTRPGAPPPVVPEASTLLMLCASGGALAGYVAVQWRARRRE